jgi:hypothetical protein
MFVTNHVLSGVVIGQVLADRPLAAFAVGVASHLALDAVPHWGCDSHAPDGYARFIRAARVDGVLALGAMAVGAVAVTPGSRTATIAAMAGAALLDLDKPANYFFNFDPFPEVINRVHRRIQNESPEGLTREILYGLVFAVVDALTIAGRRSKGALT